MMLTREDVFDYADNHGKGCAADYLRLAGPDNYEGADYEELLAYLEMRDIPKEPEYTSAYNGDYSPSCPWNAPGMSVHDFI